MKKVLDRIDALFHPDGPAALFVSRIGALIGLNLLWLICSLPVVTLGPATVAMHYVLLQRHSGRSDLILKPFFHAFRRDFWQGVALGIPVMALFALQCFNALYIYGTHPDALTPLWIPYFVGVAFLAALVVYGFPLVARYALPWRDVLRNCVALLARNPLLTAVCAMGHFLPVLLLLFAPALWWNISFFWLLIGGALTSSLCDRKILAVFEQSETAPPQETPNSAP